MPLLEPRVERIAPRDPAPRDDRADQRFAAGTVAPLAAELLEIVGERGLLGRATDLIRYASDASPYRRIPAAVVQPRTVQQVAALMARARRAGLPMVFRGGGTSLSGQAQTDGVLADVRRHWSGLEVLDDGARVRVKPGTLLGNVNRALAPYGRRLGPDPASTEIATVGGVVANNSGGMRCGVARDSYSTVSELSFALPSGTIIDTGAPDAAERFAAAEPELAAGLAEIRDSIRSDADLRERIRRKFEIKNTTGYRLCAFLDADEPVEIFRRLLIGSEGTLAFISEVVFETVPLPPMTTLSWVHFESIDAATAPVADLVAAGATAVELMVAPALMVAANSIPGTPEYWKELPLESAALLIEFGADDAEGLAAGEAAAAEVLAPHEPFRAADFTREPETIELFWRVREGLHGLIGRLRPPSTALIIEDVCVPPAQIADAARDVRELLTEHGFLGGVAGHASAGNLHFMLTPDFAVPADVERYESFMEKLVAVIVDTYDGSLKAEHGTGVNMAPFVEREWGAAATELMWRIKALADPDGVLGPGIVLNRDPGCHLENLKTTPEIEESATACVECGFCEPVCPSRDLTTTPRQRIVLRREMARQPAGSPLLRALVEEYEYDGLQTCAVDGSCMHACPLGIDTGALVKQTAGQRARGARGAGRAAGGPALGQGRAERPRRPADRWRDRRRGRRRGPRGDHRRRPARGQRRAGPGVGAADAPARLRRAAADDPGWGRRRLPARLREPDLWTRRRVRRRAGVAAGGARGRLRPRRQATLDPRRRRGQLLRDPVDVEGLSRRRGLDGELDGGRPLALVRRGTAAGGDRRELLHPRLARGLRSPHRGEPRAARGDEHSRFDRLGVGASDRLAARGREGRHRGHPPDLLVPAPRPRRCARAGGGGAGGAGGRPGDGGVLRLRRRPRVSAPGADRIGDPGGGARGRGDGG